MSKRVAIVQSNYIPWKGYFDLIAMVDEFILYDDRQYTRRDWRNRNLLKTPQGARWLTIPVEVKGRYDQRIDETLVSDPSWAADHWAVLTHAYSRADHFASHRVHIAELYREAAAERHLSLINRRFIKAVCELLGIRTKLSWSTEYAAEGARTERLVALCRAAGATEYLSGPAARAYMDESLFAAAGITLRYMDYSGYPEYPQLHPPFGHHVSIVDLIFNVGDDARRYLKSFGAEGAGPR
ncbi:MAG: hypothetical protein EXQ81_10470 [Thermoleophilia bacterium]|nr:hypothetical protein [Thermoleophilia bacterium]